MRIVFMGTPHFAIPSLNILHENHLDIVAVVTVPDKPQGRGQQLLPSPVKQFALKHGLPLLQPHSLNDPAFIERLHNLEPDLFVVVAFRILPKEVFSIPRLGSFNLHASLLPKYRGAAPIHWAIIRGEKETGVTTFLLQEQVDTGNILMQARVPIGPDETAEELHNKLADVGAEIVLHTVRLIELGKVTPTPQDERDATPAPKIFKEDCRINWNASAQDVHNFVRGLSPSPCAFTYHGDRLIKIFRTRLSGLSFSTTPGTIAVIDEQIIVTTATRGVELLELQQEGKRRLAAREFLHGYRLKSGDQFR